MESLKRFFSPLSYLRISRCGKYTDELIIPAVLTAISAFVFMLADWKVPIFGDQGVISGVSSYLQVVSGFYIASLAAIATFNKESMDNKMAGDPPTLEVRVNGVLKLEELTRRRFMCLLFGYLALMSVILYFSGVGLNVVAPYVDFGAANVWLKYMVGFGYMFLGYNLICTTMLGLYYMADRIHRVDPVFTEVGFKGDKQVANQD